MTSRHYAFVLSALTGAFVFRVIAQLVQAWNPVNFLPPYETWQSGALPYSVLVTLQVVIVIVCLRIIWGISREVLTPSRRKGRILFALGLLYFIGMSIRLFVGLVLAPDHYWFGATVPTVFHLVLACFVTLHGRFHLKFSQFKPSKYRNNPT